MGHLFPLNFSNFELEITDRCNLACPRCSRTELLERFPNVKLNHDLSLDEFKRFIEPVLPQIDIFEFKGTMGEPIFHHDFIGWVRWVKSLNKRVFLHTNGQSGKKIWSLLANHLTKDDKIVLGIDGMPDDFMKYRINAKWQNIQNAVTELKGKCHLVWQFIVFSYNQHEIEDARKLSVELGFDEFLVYYSPKWQDGNDWLKPSKELAHERGNQAAEIDPACTKRPMHIVTADGYYMPCCYLIDPRWRYKTPWAKAFKISDCTINDIIKSSISSAFFAKLDNESAPSYCRFQCGKCNG